MAAFFDADDHGRPLRLRTSGTSERPRSVVRTTGSWTASFPHVTALLEMNPSSRVWVPGPLSSTMNLFAAVHARALGADLCRAPERATHAHLTPSWLQRALDERRPVDGVHVVVAGDRLPRPLHDRAITAGARVSHYYGSAELSFVAWGSHEDNLRPFHEVEVDVRSGVLWARSPYLCQGYDGPPGALRTDADGFATVGDRCISTDGYLILTGRGGSAVTTAGATVHVADVEQALRRAGPGEVFVVGVSHPTLGEVVAAVLTDADCLAGARVTARASLTRMQQPRLWFEIRRPPLTPAGKVDRVALAELVTSSGPGVRRLS